jgi:hypothetical protein
LQPGRHVPRAGSASRERAKRRSPTERPVNAAKHARAGAASRPRPCVCLIAPARPVAAMAAADHVGTALIPERARVTSAPALRPNVMATAWPRVRRDACAIRGIAVAAWLTTACVILIRPRPHAAQAQAIATAQPWGEHPAAPLSAQAPCASSMPSARAANASSCSTAPTANACNAVLRS